MKKLCFLFATVCLIQTVQSQSISPQVIANGGYSLSAGGAILDFTVGELVIQTLNVPGNMVTQGFHQTYTTSSSIEGNGIQLTIQVYPNPTYDFINVFIDGDQSIDFIASVYDGYGRNILNSLKSNSSKLQIDLSMIAAGSYYINLNNCQSNIPIKTIKIQKLSNQ